MRILSEKIEPLMPHLYLVRHAKAEAIADEDHMRCLTQAGRNDAMNLGGLFEQGLMQPDLVICSTAIRTQQTFEMMQNAGLSTSDVRFDEGLYHASSDYIWQIVRQANRERVMVIGHNPAMAILLNNLIPDDQIPPDLMHFPTATIAHLSFDAENFSTITENTLKVLHSLQKGATLS